MPTVKQITDLLYKWAPPELAAPWDNVGLQIGDVSQHVSSVLLSLDVDTECLTQLDVDNYDLVITHHPIFFKPIKQVLFDSDMGAILETFLKLKVSLLSLHTNLDAAEGGVNDALIGSYGITPHTGTILSRDGFGKWFDMQPAPLQDYIDLMPCTVQGFTAERNVSRIGFCGGSGHGLIQDAVRENCDVFITGEITYHDHVYAEMHNLTVLTLGHKESEVLVLPVIRERLLDAFPDLNIDILGLSDD
jgi:dinuclear metal center YbgI/SA1388 family protein